MARQARRWKSWRKILLLSIFVFIDFGLPSQRTGTFPSHTLLLKSGYIHTYIHAYVRIYVHTYIHRRDFLSRWLAMHRLRIVGFFLGICVALTCVSSVCSVLKKEKPMMCKNCKRSSLVSIQKSTVPKHKLWETKPFYDSIATYHRTRPVPFF
jgi:hypothetical protein